MMQLRGQEIDVWNATYAAATVALELDPRTNSASEGARTVRAIELANASVRRLQDRRATGDPHAGKNLWD